jgi:hypothetical protein
MKSVTTWITPAALAVLSLSCTTRDLAETLPVEEGEIRTEIFVDQNRKLDLLFVIDNSGSMGQEQESLAQNFGNFISVLENIPDPRSPTGRSLPDLHIGVVSSNVGTGGHDLGTSCADDGDDGKLQRTARVSGCTPPDGDFIADEQDETGQRVRNYRGDLAATFQCIAQLGTKGCGLEQHLEAMRRALDGRNPGFLRDDAFLAVVVIADEDDCSAKDFDLFDPTGLAANARGLVDFRCVQEGTECGGERIGTEARTYAQCTPRKNASKLEAPETYATFLKTLKRDPRQVYVAGITGDPSPFAVITNTDKVPTPQSVCPDATPDVCSDPDPDPKKPCREPRAEPGVRLRHFLSLFDADRSTFTSICQKDLRSALEYISAQLVPVLSTSCIAGRVDPVLDCVVSDVTNLGECEVFSSRLPRCQIAGDGTVAPDQAKPCWWTRANEGLCIATPHLELLFERTADPPTGTRVVARCKAL